MTNRLSKLEDAIFQIKIMTQWVKKACSQAYHEMKIQDTIDKKKVFMIPENEMQSKHKGTRLGLDSSIAALEAGSNSRGKCTPTQNSTHNHIINHGVRIKIFLTHKFERKKSFSSAP